MTQIKPLPQSHLHEQRAELAELRTRLIDRECYLSILRAELAAFHDRYSREVGFLYAILDDWNARIAELVAAKSGTLDATRAAEEARAEANESREAAAEAELAISPKKAPSPELKKLFRKVMNCVHPDRSRSESDLLLRNRLTIEANAAMERHDAVELERIMSEYQSKPASEQKDSPVQDLVREIQQVLARLQAIELQILELTSTELAKLMAKVESEALRGRDVLKDVSSTVRTRIADAEKRFENLFTLTT